MLKQIDNLQEFKKLYNNGLLKKGIFYKACRGYFITYLGLGYSLRRVVTMLNRELYDYGFNSKEVVAYNTILTGRKDLV